MIDNDIGPYSHYLDFILAFWFASSLTEIKYCEAIELGVPFLGYTVTPKLIIILEFTI